MSLLLRLPEVLTDSIFYEFCVPKDLGALDVSFCHKAERGIFHKILENGSKLHDFSQIGHYSNFNFMNWVKQRNICLTEVVFGGMFTKHLRQIKTDKIKIMKIDAAGIYTDAYLHDIQDIVNRCYNLYALELHHVKNVPLFSINKSNLVEMLTSFEFIHCEPHYVEKVCQVMSAKCSYLVNLVIKYEYADAVWKEPIVDCSVITQNTLIDLIQKNAGLYNFSYDCGGINHVQLDDRLLQAFISNCLSIVVIEIEDINLNFSVDTVTKLIQTCKLLEQLTYTDSENYTFVRYVRDNENYVENAAKTIQIESESDWTQFFIKIHNFTSISFHFVSLSTDMNYAIAHNNSQTLQNIHVIHCTDEYHTTSLVKQVLVLCKKLNELHVKDSNLTHEHWCDMFNNNNSDGGTNIDCTSLTKVCIESSLTIGPESLVFLQERSPNLEFLEATNESVNHEN